MAHLLLSDVCRLFASLAFLLCKQNCQRQNPRVLLFTHVFSMVKQNSREVPAGQKWEEWWEQESKRPAPWWNAQCYSGNWWIAEIFPLWLFLIQGLTQLFATKECLRALYKFSSVACNLISGSCRKMAPYQSPPRAECCLPGSCRTTCHLLTATAWIGKEGSFHPSSGWEVSSSLGKHTRCPGPFILGEYYSARD